MRCSLCGGRSSCSLAVMAAAPELHARVLELRHVRPEAIQPLLEEESTLWRQSLDWDFRPSAALVQRFIDMQALSGFVLLHDDRVIGYSYFVTEEHKGLIGDLYVLKQYATPENEYALLAAVLEKLMKTPMLHRVESQLMMLRSAQGVSLPHWRYLHIYDRRFLQADLAGARKLPPGLTQGEFVFDQWTERRQDEAAALIAEAYRGHIDSEINDQYRSASGARRFLMNIVQYPGCGSFFQASSFVAIHRASGRMAGIVLSSLVSEDVGHITQICVSHAFRQQGVGYELLRRSLFALAAAECRTASLTVTAGNAGAIQLYERMGFRDVRGFPALVWDGF